MIKFKKIISVLLTASMLASIGAIAASAEDETEQTTETVSDESTTETVSDEQTIEETSEISSETDMTTEEAEADSLLPENANLGDVNYDGVIDAKDATILLEESCYVLNGKESSVPLEIADIDKNGTLDPKDATCILIYTGFCILHGDDICSIEEFQTSEMRQEYFRELDYKDYLEEYESVDYDTFCKYYDEYDPEKCSDIICRLNDYIEYRYYCDNVDPNVDEEMFLTYISTVVNKKAWNWGYDVLDLDEVYTFFDYIDYRTKTYGLGWDIEKSFVTSTDYQNFLKTRETK